MAHLLYSTTATVVDAGARRRSPTLFSFILMSCITAPDACHLSLVEAKIRTRILQTRSLSVLCMDNAVSRFDDFDYLHDLLFVLRIRLLFGVLDPSYNLHYAARAPFLIMSILCSIFFEESQRHCASHFLLSIFTHLVLGDSSEERVQLCRTVWLYRFKYAALYAVPLDACHALQPPYNKPMCLGDIPLASTPMNSFLVCSPMPCQGAQQCRSCTFLVVSTSSAVNENPEKWNFSSLQSVHSGRLSPE